MKDLKEGREGQRQHGDKQHSKEGTRWVHSWNTAETDVPEDKGGVELVRDSWRRSWSQRPCPQHWRGPGLARESQTHQEFRKLLPLPRLPAVLPFSIPSPILRRSWVPREHPHPPPDRRVCVKWGGSFPSWILPTPSYLLWVRPAMERRTDSRFLTGGHIKGSTSSSRFGRQPS